VFELEDPIGIARTSENNGDAFVHEVEITPGPGLMVLFPSTLRHRVEPYRGDSQRITIAWNLFHSRFHIPDGGGAENSSSNQRSQTLWHAKQVLNSVSGVVRNPSILLRKMGLSNAGPDTEDDAIQRYLRDVSELNP
jgi:hypothetical protein